MSGTKDEAKQLLKLGHAPGVVAKVLGVDPSLISQFLADEEFASEVEAARAAKLTKSLGLDALYDELEGTVLEKLKHNMAMVNSPVVLASIASKLNAAKRRGVVQHAAVDSAPVELMLPQVIVNNFIMSATNQIVAVNEKPVTTIQVAALESVANEIQREVPKLQHEQVKSISLDDI